MLTIQESPYPRTRNTQLSFKIPTGVVLEGFADWMKRSKYKSKELVAKRATTVFLCVPDGDVKRVKKELEAMKMVKERKNNSTDIKLNEQMSEMVKPRSLKMPEQSVTIDALAKKMALVVEKAAERFCERKKEAEDVANASGAFCER